MAEEEGQIGRRIEPLGKSHDRKAFSCGKPPLDDYLKHRARQDAERHIAAPFVLLDDADGRSIIGYYTLSSFSIELNDLPEQVTKKLPRYPVVPATLIGRIAVDERYAGKGFGEILLIDALKRAHTHTEEVASFAVVVEAMDDDAVRFYEHFGFILFPDHESKLFLPMKTIAELFK